MVYTKGISSCAQPRAAITCVSGTTRSWPIFAATTLHIVGQKKAACGAPPPARPRDPQPAWAAYVTGVPVDMRGDRLRRAFEAYGPVVRVEPLPIRYPKRGARSAIVVFGDAQSLERAMRAAPWRVDGARLGVRRFGDPEPSQQAEGSANAVGRQERHALAAAGLVVFAGGVPAACGDAEIKAAFECYGQVSRAWSFPANGSGDGGRARCAFVVFSDTSSAARAIASAREGGRLRLRGRALAVERPAGAPEDIDEPRRGTHDAAACWELLVHRRPRQICGTRGDCAAQRAQRPRQPSEDTSDPQGRPEQAARRHRVRHRCRLDEAAAAIRARPRGVGGGTPADLQPQIV